MAAGLSPSLHRLAPFARLLALGSALLASRAGGAPPAASPRAAEKAAAEAARAGNWTGVLEELVRLQRADPGRYAEGRFDFLAARALAATGRVDEALPRFERFIAVGDIFDVPARIAAARLRFGKGEGVAALDVLLPLLQRREGAVSRGALRMTLDALETSLDRDLLARLQAARPQAAPRERRRLQALSAAVLDADGRAAEAAAIRRALLDEARRDDAAAIVLARELAGLPPREIAGDRLPILVEAARAQRDLDLAERLAAERLRRLGTAGGVEVAAATFDLARIRASRGKFEEAAKGYRVLLASPPRGSLPAKGLRDDAPGTSGFLSRVRFNLGAVLEKLQDLDGASREFARVEESRVGPAALATLQRARLEIRRGRLDAAERLLGRDSIARQPGRVEGTLLLLLRRAEAGDGRGASRALAKVEALAARRRLPEPWRSEMPFWRGRAAESRGDLVGAAAQYARLLSTQSASVAGQLAKERLLALPTAVRTRLLSALLREGKSLLAAGKAAKARGPLAAPALLGTPGGREALLAAYAALPIHGAVLLVPDYDGTALATLCGDAGACRLLQLGLPRDAEPVVRDARRLDSLHGCIVAARLAEDADAGPAALEAAEALARRLPPDFLVPLAPAAVRRALAPRPFARLVRSTAAEMKVPEELLYAVMRQESRFDREAVSPAAARGLMQLTLPAAGEAAHQLNEEAPAYAELYDPSRSVRLGATTLRSLLERFGADAASAVSGYNAGAGQTSLWRGGARQPAEALLGAISYPETRSYLRRVLLNRYLYAFPASSTAP